MFLSCARFGVLVPLLVDIPFFCDIMVCRRQRFEEVCGLRLQVNPASESCVQNVDVMEGKDRIGDWNCGSESFCIVTGERVQSYRMVNKTDS